MRVSKLRAFLLTLVLAACGGKSIKTTGGEAGSGSECDQTSCGDDCVDTSSDPRHCGRCDRHCGGDEQCVDGDCVSMPSCAPNENLCSGQCVDLRFSNENCGGCGRQCTDDAYCSNGVCVTQCFGGQCNGRCVDFSSDPANCGTCGFSCGPGQYCSGGACAPLCEGGAFCNGVCVDVFSDPYNCGDCGSQCLGPGLVCSGGVCQNQCPADTLFCNGICVDWRFDSSNCGGCGFRCADGELCSNGSCVPTCEMGSLCNGQCVDLGSNPSHCGRCNFACGPASACVGGMCVMGACGDGIVEPGEEADPPPGPLAAVPLDRRTCRYDFSRIDQWYCHGTCGNWGGPNGCDQFDANAFCRLKMDNPNSTATSFSVGESQAAPGVCCPPPSYQPGDLGCTSLGVLSSRGVPLNVSVHPTSLSSTHRGGTVITNLLCTDP